MIQELGEEQPAAIGAAIGGPLDWQTGIVSPLHQPEWRNVQLKEIMEATWHCPFHVDVDTNIAALGECRFGGETANPLIYLTLSTGMGGGIIVNGRIYRGANGAHPELAHQSIPYEVKTPHEISCECGAPDCLEALVSGNGIQRVYARPAAQLTQDEWNEVAHNLGQGLRNIAALVDPRTDRPRRRRRARRWGGIRQSGRGGDGRASKDRARPQGETQLPGLRHRPPRCSRRPRYMASIRAAGKD